MNCSSGSRHHFSGRKWLPPHENEGNACRRTGRFMAALHASLNLWVWCFGRGRLQWLWIMNKFDIDLCRDTIFHRILLYTILVGKIARIFQWKRVVATKDLGRPWPLRFGLCFDFLRTENAICFSVSFFGSRNYQLFSYEFLSLK